MGQDIPRVTYYECVRVNRFGAVVVTSAQHLRRPMLEYRSGDGKFKCVCVGGGSRFCSVLLGKYRESFSNQVTSSSFQFIIQRYVAYAVQQIHN
jgi:hypothetical protein